jgi:tetratricopeptide (TPR) repeat protein
MPAAEHYQAYVELDDRSPRVLYKLGLSRYKAGQSALAIEALKKAIAIDDRFAEAHYLMGLCQRSAQQPSEALASLRRAISLSPTMFHAREELADLYTRLNRPDDSIAELEVLNALDPGPARAVTLGLAYARAGQADRAVITLRRAAERYPDHHYTFVALGRVWLETAQARADRVELNKALEALEHAVGVEDSSEAYMLFGRALLLASDDELAERMLVQATQKLPADPLAFYYLADAAERRLHFDVARQALLDYSALDGDDADLKHRANLAVRVGDLSMKIADFPLAAVWYDRASPSLSSDPAFVVKFAEAKWRNGQADAARVMLDKLLEKDPLNAQARALRRRLH